MAVPYDITTFDDLMSKVNYILQNSCTEEFLKFVSYVDNNIIPERSMLREEVINLKNKLLSCERELSETESKLNYYKKILNEEKYARHVAESDRHALRCKLKEAINLMLDDKRNDIVEETKVKLTRIGSTIHLNEDIGEKQTDNLSLFSELSFSTESTDNISDELLSEKSFRRRKAEKSKYNPCGNSSAKKMRNDTPLNTPIYSKPNTSKSNLNTSIYSKSNLNTPIYSKSILKNNNKSSENSSDSNSNDDYFSPQETPRKQVVFATDVIHKRCHNFDKYKCLIPQTCSICHKLLTYNKQTSKCTSCKIITHIECEKNVPIPCVPAPHTPVHLHKTLSGNIAAYTPFLPPMIPGLVIHCINAVENSGLNQEYIYKYGGHPEQIKDLLKELVSEKKYRLENLMKTCTIHSICSALKEFFLSLDEHLIPASHWQWFEKTLEEDETECIRVHLYSGLIQLPQPNRDTLAYLILHLQKVVETSSTNMTTKSISEIFGPIIIGTDNSENLSKKLKTSKIFEHLMNIPSDYWNHHIVPASSSNGMVTPSMQELRNTPTSDMALVQTINRRGGTTPFLTRSEKKKYFRAPSWKVD